MRLTSPKSSAVGALGVKGAKTSHLGEESFGDQLGSRRSEGDTRNKCKKVRKRSTRRELMYEKKMKGIPKETST
jgi:hypothetical protein